MIEELCLPRRNRIAAEEKGRGGKKKRSPKKQVSRDELGGRSWLLPVASVPYFMWRGDREKRGGEGGKFLEVDQEQETLNGKYTIDRSRPPWLFFAPAESAATRHQNGRER